MLKWHWNGVITNKKKTAGLAVILLTAAFVFQPVGVGATPEIDLSQAYNYYKSANSNNGVSANGQPVVIKSVAMLPIENLTDNKLASGIIYDYIKRELKGKGWVLISREGAVEEFLEKRRIRYTGAITRVAAREMGKVLGVDAIFIGSVNSYTQSGDKVIVGVSCRLISTVDGSIAWADNLTYTGKDFEGILGLGVVRSLDILADIVVKDLVKSIADKFFMRETAFTPFEIERVIIYPTIGRAGDERDLKVKFLPLMDSPKEARAIVNGEEIILTNVGGDEYEGVIHAPEMEGSYTVDIIAMDSNFSPSSFDAATKVVVDSTPPVINFAVSRKILSAKKKGVVVFEPKLMNFEDIDEWKIEISDVAGKRVRGDRGYGKIPDRLVWRGENDKMGLVADGEYTVKFMAKDAAGNESVSTDGIKVKSNPPQIKVDVDIAENMAVFILSRNSNDVIQSWKISIQDKEGNLVKVFEGAAGEFPEKLEYPLDENTDMAKLNFSITAEDDAGNTFNMTKTFPSLFARKVPFAKLKGKMWEDF